MIVRDEHGIICQGDANDPSYKDGGDSASRTGIMSLNSLLDSSLLPLFITETNELVRHPTQKKWNDPKETSRDQLVAYFVSIRNSAVAHKYAKQWFINKDFLSPIVKLHFYKASGFSAPIWLKVLGKIEMALAMYWNTKIKPDEEMNQFTCVCIRLGYARELFVKHPNLVKNIREYFSGWRDQREIGEALISEVMKSIVASANK